MNDAVVMFKCLNKLVSYYLAEKFIWRSEIHTKKY